MAKRTKTVRRISRAQGVVEADAGLEQARKASRQFKGLLSRQQAGHGHHHEASIREDHYKGHHIVIKTTYTVTVDGKPFKAALEVANSGRVQYHAIPNVGFTSAIDLMRSVIDQFPGDFKKSGGGTGGTGGHDDHGEHGGHDHHAASPRHRARKSGGRTRRRTT